MRPSPPLAWPPIPFRYYYCPKKITLFLGLASLTHFSVYLNSKTLRAMENYRFGSKLCRSGLNPSLPGHCWPACTILAASLAISA